MRNKHLLVYVVYTIAFIFSIKNDRYIFNNSTSIDLRYRVIGSRLMEDGRSPYYDKWKAGDSNAARYYHPIPRYSQEINGVTVTPVFLWLNSVFANNDFCEAAEWWFYLQMIVLFLCGLILLTSFRDFSQKIIGLAGFSLFFAYSRNFQLHLHSAQVYVVYALIFCLLYQLLKSKWRKRYVYIGLLIGTAVWLKPFFVVLFIPFLLAKNRQVFKGALIMLFIGLAQVALTGQTAHWKEYISAMPKYAEDVRLSDEADFMQVVPPSFDVASCIFPMKYPDELPLLSTGLRSVQYYLFRMRIDFSEPKVYGIIALILVTAIALYKRKGKLTTEQFLAMMFLLYLTVELFTPALRFGYYLVQWAAVALIILVNYRQNKIAAGLMLLGLLINHGYVPFPDVYEGMAGETLMVFALVLFVFSNGTTKTNLNEVNIVPNVEVSDTTRVK